MKHEKNLADMVSPILGELNKTETVGFIPKGFSQKIQVSGEPSTLFLLAKRLFDILFGFCLAPVVLMVMCVLLLANRFKNPGPMFFVQTRMGQDCQPFSAIKFRSMVCADVIKRDANCPLEEDRITPLGKLLRKTRIDELPQVLNVLKGDMSLIGPRPDYFEHAQYFVEHVPGYRERHSVKPGISGLAQTEVGYAAGIEATRTKVSADIYYIENRSFALEAWIFWRTLAVVIGRGGA